MKSRLTYTEEEALQIRKLLKLKARAMASEQQSFRSHLRRLGFHISDFDELHTGFSAGDFDRLIREGAIRVKKSEAESARQ